MFVYYFKVGGKFGGKFRALHTTHLEIDWYPNRANNCCWMVPGTFDCDGNSTL